MTWILFSHTNYSSYSATTTKIIRIIGKKLIKEELKKQVTQKTKEAGNYKSCESTKKNNGYIRKNEETEHEALWNINSKW